MAGRPDVVVVGAGSAGAVLAARLSDDPRRSVLLLEAGPDHDSAHTPASIAGPSFHQAVAEPGRSWPDLVARRRADLPPRQYLRGRGVGGSSAVNAMVALPGPAGDYDEWASYGLDGWSWAEVEPWFARIPLPLREAPPAERGPLARALLTAGLGAEPARLTRTADGRRVSVNDAYLEPARARPNLQVRGDALVDRVLLDGRRAVGVRLATGEEVEAGAVIVAAGAIHSPAILLRSGVDRPAVGHGLQDHPSFPILVEYRDGCAPAGGSLAVSALLRARHRLDDDLQLLAVDVIDPASPTHGMVGAALMRVESRGTVRLASSDPLVDPDVDFAMCTDDGDRDLEGMRAAVRLAERFLDSEAFHEVATVVPYDASDDGIRAAVGDYVHASSTCRMGSLDDEQAVVDSGCAVIGHQGLWVCDASVLPRVPRANTHLPVVMVAERVAGLLAGRLSSSRRPG